MWKKGKWKTIHNPNHSIVVFRKIIKKKGRKYQCRLNLVKILFPHPVGPWIIEKGEKEPRTLSYKLSSTKKFVIFFRFCCSMIYTFFVCLFLFVVLDYTDVDVDIVGRWLLMESIMIIWSEIPNNTEKKKKRKWMNKRSRLSGCVYLLLVRNELNWWTFTTLAALVSHYEEGKDEEKSWIKWGAILSSGGKGIRAIFINIL